MTCDQKRLGVLFCQENRNVAVFQICLRLAEEEGADADDESASASGRRKRRFSEILMKVDMCHIHRRSSCCSHGVVKSLGLDPILEDTCSANSNRKIATKNGKCPL